MELELSILLGLNCNFSCRHCLNDSQPGKKTLDLSEIDCDKIIDQVSHHEEIKSISFVGGGG